MAKQIKWIDDTRVELKAFDETHPEIIAQITKEREEATERHLWD